MSLPSLLRIIFSTRFLCRINRRRRCRCRCCRHHHGQTVHRPHFFVFLLMLTMFAVAAVLCWETFTLKNRLTENLPPKCVAGSHTHKHIHTYTQQQVYRENTELKNELPNAIWDEEQTSAPAFQNGLSSFCSNWVMSSQQTETPNETISSNNSHFLLPFLAAIRLQNISVALDRKVWT